MSCSNVFYKKLKLFFIILITFNYLIAKSTAYFSPEDKISDKLIEQINHTKKRIYAAIYILTDKSIANALIEAKKRNIDIQIVTDISCLQNEYNKIDLLKNNGIEIFIYKPKLKNNKFSNAIMHNKFAILDNKIWTGSFNWTVSANKKNQENVVYIKKDLICKKYEKEFEKLKRKCMLPSSTNEQPKNLKEKIIKLFKCIRNSF
ncbi:DUF1669 domain-containing protein [Candidatus Dependentiae bacterium]|nr:DUF1669 domain-containing protein [Candidatus Dependentiae bacterium]